MSSRGTVTRPPPGPPPMSLEAWRMGDSVHLYELPKLGAADLGTSAVACGNWMAQIRQVFVGISPSSASWWMSVERAATQQYQRWLIADPVDRLVLDPVVADLDLAKYQRVESRAVSLLLSAVSQNIRDESVSNRWLTSASLLFRVQCIYQPGGLWECSMLLTGLVNTKTLAGAVTMSRRWQQHFYRVRELHAALPDSSLLLRGIDVATSALLLQNPS